MQEARDPASLFIKSCGNRNGDQEENAHVHSVILDCFLRAVLSASLAKPFDGGIFSFSCQDQLSNDTQGKGDSLDTTDCLESNLGLMWVKGDPMEDGDAFLEGQGQNKPWGGLLTPICRLPLSKRRRTLIS